MGTADILIIAVLLFFAIKGVVKGLIIEIFGILGIVLAFLCSFMVYTPVYIFVTSIGLKDGVASVASYFIGFLLVYCIIIILGNILHKALVAIQLGWLNRLGGFLFGGFKGAVIASLILWVLVYTIPRSSTFYQDIANSPVAKSTMKVVPYIYGKINEISGIDRVSPFNK